MTLHIDTPLLESGAMGVAGQTVWLKMDALQPPGSFKIRGIGHACEEYRRRGATRFISSSGGNAGIAAAYAGRRLGVPVLVVVPETTSERARELIRRERAEVIVHGASFQEANALAQSMVTASDAFIHPFDDPLLWQGHASMIDEVAAKGVRPDAVVLSVGGGGLLCGVVEGLRRNGWDDVPVVAVETAGADSYARSLAAQHPVRSVVVTDEAAVQACLRFMDDQRVVVEPACGASLAVAYEAGTRLEGVRNVLVIVCGGVTATVAQLQAWQGNV